MVRYVMVRGCVMVRCDGEVCDGERVCDGGVCDGERVCDGEVCNGERVCDGEVCDGERVCDSVDTVTLHVASGSVFTRPFPSNSHTISTTKT